MNRFRVGSQTVYSGGFVHVEGGMSQRQKIEFSGGVHRDGMRRTELRRIHLTVELTSSDES